MDAAAVREIYGAGISEADVEKLVGADRRTTILNLELQKAPSARNELSDLFRSCRPYEVRGRDSGGDIRDFLMDFSPLRDCVPSATVPPPGDDYYRFFKKLERPSKLANLVGELVSGPTVKGLGEEYVAADSMNFHTIWGLLDRSNPSDLQLGLSFGKNISEKGSQYFKVFKPTLSPDSHITCNGSLLLYSEEKKDDELFLVAEKELLVKLAELPTWLYGKLKFLVCYASTPGKIQFYMMEVSKSGPRLKKITPLFVKDDPVHRIMIVLVAFKMYFLLMGMQQAVHTQPMYPLGQDSKHGNSLIRLTVIGARKIIPEWDAHCKKNQVDFDTIVESYTAARDAQGHLVSSVLLPRLMKASELSDLNLIEGSSNESIDDNSLSSPGKRRNASESSSSSSRKKRKCLLSQLDANSNVYVVQTSPLCGTKIPSTEPDLREMALGVVRALRALHSKGLVHRDIREPNVMYDYQKNKYVLIDLEGVCKAGQVPTVQYKCWDGCTLDGNGTFTKKSDYQLLGLLLSSYVDIEKSADCEKFIELLLNKHTDDANALLPELWLTNKG